VSGGEKTLAATSAALTPQPLTNMPDLLREKAKQILEGIDEAKIMKAPLSALSLGADRLLNRAEAIENRGTSLTPFMEMFERYGIQRSHAVSRLTVKTTKEVQVTAEQHRSTDPG
jgi:hypothetical protein